jgi:hypothetical protein
VFEVNHGRHTTVHTTKSSGIKPDLFQVVIALKCSKKSTGFDHILLSSNREVKHTFLYPQMLSFYLVGIVVMVMDGFKKIQCGSPVIFSAPQYLSERCFVSSVQGLPTCHDEEQNVDEYLYGASIE